MNHRDIIKQHEAELDFQVRTAIMAAIRLGKEIGSLADDLGITTEEVLSSLGASETPIRAILALGESATSIAYGIDNQ